VTRTPPRRSGRGAVRGPGL